MNRVGNTVMLPVYEYERLKNDATRYQWLKANDRFCRRVDDDELDSYIDKAIAERSSK